MAPRVGVAPTYNSLTAKSIAFMVSGNSGKKRSISRLDLTLVSAYRAIKIPKQLLKIVSKRYSLVPSVGREIHRELPSAQG